MRLARRLQGVGLNQNCVVNVSQCLQMPYWLRSRASFFAKHYSDITHYAVHFLISSATMIRFDCFHIGVGLRGSCVLIDDVLVCAGGQLRDVSLCSHKTLHFKEAALLPLLFFRFFCSPVFGFKAQLTHSGEKPVKIDTEIRMEISG